MSARIRFAVDADVEVVRGLLDDENLPTGDLRPAHLVFVAGSGDEIIGAIGLEPFGEIGLLRSLVVAPAARSAGLGRKLVDSLEAYARQQAVQELWLLTIDADGWFARLGYSVREREDAPPEIRETAAFAGLCPADAVLMSKFLS
jgi:amino-acid N-acetyltransferase